MSPALGRAITAIGWWCLLASLGAEPRPNPILTPQQVIHTVVEVLQHSNSPIPNAGIFTVYQFASPKTRGSIGPYGRFLRLVKSPTFSTLVTGNVTDYGPLSIAGDLAQQAVSFRVKHGELVWFQFILSRQTSEQTQGRCSGCWMVDEVTPMDFKQ